MQFNFNEPPSDGFRDSLMGSESNLNVRRAADITNADRVYIPTIYILYKYINNNNYICSMTLIIYFIPLR